MPRPAVRYPAGRGIAVLTLGRGPGLLGRVVAVLGVALLSSSLIVANPSVARASVVVPPPVADIPDVPSRTVKSLTGAVAADMTAVQMATIWKAMLGAVRGSSSTSLAPAAGAAAETVSSAPKVLTPAAQMTRGASGGPLFAAFTGGFALGTAGLQVYGVVTGDDPLDGICGTPFEGPGYFMYMGMMPECDPVVPATPNADLPSGPSGAVSAGPLTAMYIGSVVDGSASYYCYSGTVRENAPIEDDTWYFQYHSYYKPGGYDSWQNAYARPGTFPGACSSIGGIASVLIYPEDHSTFYRDGRIRIAYRDAQGNTTIEATMALETPNPVRTAGCSIDWDDGTTTTGGGVQYQESDGLPMDAASLGCSTAWDAKPGAGREVWPDRIGVQSEDDAGAITQIADQDVPEFSETEKIAMEPSLGNGRGLVLEKTVDGVTESCMDWSADCVDWWPSTSQGTVPTTGTTTYECTFGGAALALTECSPYQTTFDVKTSAPTITDPSTGTSTPWETAADPSNTIDPGVAVGTPSQQCMGTWMDDFNPLDWVLTPVKCAIVWAFVPRTEVVEAQTATIVGAWEGTPLSTLPAAVSGWSFAAPEGCSGIVLPFSQIWETADDIEILNACPGSDLAPVADMSTLFLSVMFPLGALFAVSRAFGGVVGYGGLGGGRSGD